MPGTSAFLRCVCSTKSGKKTPVSTQSKMEASLFESLIPRQDQILSTKESASVDSFLCFSLSESVWYVRVCAAWYFGSSCFVTAWLSKLLLYREAGTRTHCFRSKEKVNEVKSDDFHELYLFFSMPERLFFVPKWFYLERAIVSSFNFLSRYVFFNALRIYFQKIFYALAEEPDKLFWARLKERTFAFVGRRLEQL